jgi:hypothetical protein
MVQAIGDWLVDFWGL